MKKNQHLIGSHMSVSGGFFNAIADGMEVGCTTIQIFTKSNRQWKAKPITNKDAQLFIDAQKKSTIKAVVSHASYLINLGSITPDVQRKSFDALIDEVKRCHQLEIPYLVLHPGTAEVGARDETLQQTGKYIDQVIQETSNCFVTILIETMAGQGKSIGSSFEDLAKILEQITDKNRVGVCFDTCHVFAAGYDMTTEKNYKQTMEDFDNIIGLQHLKAFHMNDSKKPFNSRVDRHENIGEGLIGLKAFELILNDPRFTTVPKILETPQMEDLSNDKKNMQALLSLIK